MMTEHFSSKAIVLRKSLNPFPRTKQESFKALLGFLLLATVEIEVSQQAMWEQRNP